MLAADIGLAVIDPRDAEIARLKAHVAYLMKVSMSEVLPDLLDEDETTALVDFVQHLRAQTEKNEGSNPYRMEPDDMDHQRRLLERLDRVRRPLRRSIRTQFGRSSCRKRVLQYC